MSGHYVSGMRPIEWATRAWKSSTAAPAITAHRIDPERPGTSLHRPFGC
jgi:hypothetical protein